MPQMLRQRMVPESCISPVDVDSSSEDFADVFVALFYKQDGVHWGKPGHKTRLLVYLLDDTVLGQPT